MAPRTAILVAGANRHPTKRRGEVLLAALKIAYKKQYVTTANFGPGGLPMPLLQKLLELEGAKLFYAAHTAKLILETRSIDSPYYTETRLGVVADGTATQDRST